MKFIFVTGGVVSSLGKGLTAAALGTLLENRGLEVALEIGYNNAIFLHVTYVPFIKAAGELKTKPTQQSVAKLREIGIMPHVLVCRCERPLDKELRQKISMFCNVPLEAVIEEKDVDHSIYEVPLMLQRDRVDELVCRLLDLHTPVPNM